MRKLLLIFTLLAAGVINASAQQKKINGTVKDSQTNDALPFATITVVVPGQPVNKFAADDHGNFTGDAPAGATIQASFAGYQPKKVTVGDSTTITILLKSSGNLSEVVVIAYGTEKRKDLTGAITSISSQEVSEMPSTNLATALASRAPGLEVHSASTQPGASAVVNVRGLNSISQLEGTLSMGSILGDGSDFRDKLAADRARIYLDNKNICAFFSSPKVFTPLIFADGETFDQQIAFYLPGAETLLSLFNFDNRKEFNQTWHRADLGLGEGGYIIKDFLTDQPVGKIAKGQDTFSLDVQPADAMMVRLVPSN